LWSALPTRCLRHQLVSGDSGRSPSVNVSTG
jgi:hypothetical protein